MQSFLTLPLWSLPHMDLCILCHFCHVIRLILCCVILFILSPLMLIWMKEVEDRQEIKNQIRKRMLKEFNLPIRRSISSWISWTKTWKKKEWKGWKNCWPNSPTKHSMNAHSSFPNWLPYNSSEQYKLTNQLS